jgi:hypothetical protein
MAQAMIFQLSQEKQLELKRKIKTSFKKSQRDCVLKDEFTVGFDQTKKIVKLYFSKRLATYVISFIKGSKKIILNKHQGSIFLGFVNRINKLMDKIEKFLIKIFY